MAPYSARNKVPSIQKLGEELVQRLKLQNFDASKASDKDKENVAKQKAASRRKVIDPTTKNEVVIQDVDGNFESSIRKPKITVPKANVDPKQPPKPNDIPGVPAPHLPQGHGESYRETLDDLAPPEANPDKTGDYLHHSTNMDVIYHPSPVADLKASFYALESAINQVTIAIVAGIVVLNWLFVGGGFKGLFASAFVSTLVACAIHLWLRKIQEDANAINWDSERQRATAATESLVPESVEWMNSLVGVVWNLINPEMFAAMADTLEDVMQASVPQSVVQNVRVASLGLGDQAFKILSLRALPSAEEDSGHAKQKASGTSLSQEEKDKKAEERELEGEDDDSMRYYNMEASFAYHAIPAKGVVGKAKNMHLEIVFYLGIKGLFGVPLPIFVELNGIIGTVRLRFQLTPNPPFLKNVTFTFMGLPKIDASAIPMTSKGINVLDLPLISGFVNSSIAAALDIYVAPKSLIMDMSKILQGDAVKKETDAMGLIYVKIKNARGIQAQDRSGKSDPFVTLAYSEFGKPVYATRIIEQELNPTWNEQTCLLVYQDQLTAGEKLSVQLWDSDLLTKDDIVGRVDFDIRTLIKEYSNTITSRSDELKDDEGKTLPGKLNWDIGFFPRSAFKSSMRTSGDDVAVPKEIRDRKEFQDDKGVVTTQQEADVTTIPPDPSLPSGICCILIHQIENLEVMRPTGSFGSYAPWTPAQLTGENTDEEGDDLPSSYCTIMANDELKFKTRTKVKSSSPIFNAQTEQFVRDWRTAVFTVTTRNGLNREHDPIIGCVTLKLSEVLQTSSQNTAIYSLDGGLGYGRITISVLFRSVDLQLPQNYLGWDIGSLEILGENIVATGDTKNILGKSRISIHTDVGKGTIHRHWIESFSSTETSWTLKSKREGQEKDVEMQKHRILIPVRARYQTQIKLSFYGNQNRKPVAYAIYWLCDLLDNVETELTLPVWATPMPKQMTQNYISDIEQDSLPSERIATIKFKCRFKMGLDDTHRAYLKNNNERESFESWECCIAEGDRTRMVKRTTPHPVKELIVAGKVDGPEAENSDSDDDEPAVVRIPRKAPGFEREIEDNEGTNDYGFSELSKYASIDPDDDKLVQEDLSDSSISDTDLKQRRQKQDKKAQKAELGRKHRGILGVKVARNFKFLKDEVKVAGHNIKDAFNLKNRKPNLVESEI